ncbi:hypothetical protein, partial [Thauera mechernichensis]
TDIHQLSFCLNPAYVERIFFAQHRTEFSLSLSAELFLKSVFRSGEPRIIEIKKRRSTGNQ